MKILERENRLKYQSIFFIANNFRDFTILETIALIFILIKVVDGFRIFQRLNVIILALL